LNNPGILLATGNVEVVDISVPSAPRSLGKFESAASLSPDFKVTHDTELDSKRAEHQLAAQASVLSEDMGGHG
jgi:hypothetical protein